MTHTTGRLSLVTGLICMILSTGLHAQRIKNTTFYTWKTSGWTNQMFIQESYGSNGFNDSSSQYNWSGTAWQPSALRTYTYNNGTLTNLLSKTWNSNSSSWDLSGHAVFTFTTGNKLLQTVSTSWNGSTFVNSGKTENTYDQNLFIVDNTNYSWKNSAWQNNVTSAFSNNAAGNPTFTIRQHWDTAQAAWIDNSRIYSTYSGTTISNLYHEIWYQNVWHPRYAVKYSYNTANKLDSMRTLEYKNSSWQDITLQTFSYSATHYTNVSMYWNQAAASWTNSAMIVVEYEQTASASLPGVLTLNVSGVGTGSALCNGNVTADGGAAVTARGIVYNTSPNPTTSDGNVATGTGLGNFTATLTGLSPGTMYYARAYATNSVGTVYGGTQIFTTQFITGIDEKISAIFMIYPSPTRGKVTVNGLDGSRFIEMYDLDGTLVERRAVSGAVEIMDVSGLAAGAYFIRNDKGEVRRFLKE